MSSASEASQRRQDARLFAELDKRLDLLLASSGENPADRFHAVTADPKKMGYLRFLLKHYAKDPHPWTACYKDNFKRFGPKTAGLCGVLKDTIRQNADWRGKGPQPSDHGAPGVAIGEADAGAAPAWGGHHHDLSEDRPLSLLDELDLEVGVVDHCASGLDEAIEVFLAIREALPDERSVHRVLLGLDEAPSFPEVLAA